MMFFIYLDIDECSSLPCLNGGMCINEIGNYTCNCANAIGYYGRNCEKGMLMHVDCLRYYELLIVD